MKEKRIALCIGGVDPEYQSILLQAITRRCDEMKIQLAVFHTISNRYVGDRDDVGTYNIFNLVNYSCFDGLIIIPRSIKDRSAVNKIVNNALAANLPIVSIDDALDGAYTIKISDENSIEYLTDHLIEKHGLKKINFISGFENNYVSQQREDAYKRSLEKHGIKFEQHRLAYGNFAGKFAAEIVESFYKTYNEMPEAFVCANDAMAMEAVTKIVQLGYRVPDDVAVTGFDGIVMATNNSLPISTAKPNYFAMGLLAVDKLCAMLNGENERIGEVSLDNMLLFGRSCGCGSSKGMEHMSNIVFRSLYKRIEMNDFYSESIIGMIEKITCSTGFDETLGYICDYYERYSFGEKFWFCLDDAYRSQISGGASAVVGRYGYSDTIYPAVVFCKNKKFNGVEFAAEQMLPMLDRELEEHRHIMFMPLHFLDKTIGYVASTFDESVSEVNFHIIYSLLMNISMSMENSHIQGDLKQLVKQLSDLYVHDSMTGLYNRRGFYTNVNNIYTHCREEQKSVMVVSVDIDGMKYINDRFGHNEGDVAIHTVANAIQFNSNQGEIAARFGGDEFIIAAEVVGDTHAEDFVNGINSYLELYNRTSHKDYKVVVSLGSYMAVPSENMSLDEFIRVSDEMMYEKKKEHHESRENRERLSRKR